MSSRSFLYPHLLLLPCLDLTTPSLSSESDFLMSAPKVVTNPLEITKIRLQMQGETIKQTGAVSRGAIHVVRQLGLVGLYKGAGACLMRDVPFSMIYVSRARSFLIPSSFSLRRVRCLPSASLARCLG